ncbi:mercury resistance system periplasmic binding protein MerP [Rhodoferax sp. PAMC 29310]|uniref:mercury resistance system periplasmic binding protein MerP n=1 Tax=Rhodoferax sp. PAMC 29310 TaxID=2822760 RepID=UPI001B33B251|nr:mercury resistance system periplasmic binding protein MerP [Rhodoferax sp. PAMC 29310]
MKTLTILFALALGSLTVSAGTRTVTLAVPSMDCPVCPITVKKALTQVPGVSQARVNFDKRQAVVVFDDAQTNVAALTAATANAGYPATLLIASP